MKQLIFSKKLFFCLLILFAPKFATSQFIFPVTSDISATQSVAPFPASKNTGNDIMEFGFGSGHEMKVSVWDNTNWQGSNAFKAAFSWDETANNQVGHKPLAGNQIGLVKDPDIILSDEGSIVFIVYQINSTDIYYEAWEYNSLTNDWNTYKNPTQLNTASNATNPNIDGINANNFEMLAVWEQDGGEIWAIAGDYINGFDNYSALFINNNGVAEWPDVSIYHNSGTGNNIVNFTYIKKSGTQWDLVHHMENLTNIQGGNNLGNNITSLYNASTNELGKPRIASSSEFIDDSNYAIAVTRGYFNGIYDSSSIFSFTRCGNVMYGPNIINDATPDLTGPQVPGHYIGNGWFQNDFPVVTYSCDLLVTWQLTEAVVGNPNFPPNYNHNVVSITKRCDPCQGNPKNTEYLITNTTDAQMAMWPSSSSRHSPNNNILYTFYDPWSGDIYYKTSYYECLVTEPCEGFRTQTQGGWGSPPKGNNPGKYLHNNFGLAFPNGITIGCSNESLHFTQPAHITSFLPCSGTPTSLTASNVNPSCINNTFASQVLALSISVGFDLAIPNFGTSNTHLQNLFYVGTANNTQMFHGWTVQEILAEANAVLGGCTPPNPYNAQYTITDLNEVLNIINNCYIDGTGSCNSLSCTFTAGSLKVFPTSQDGTNSKPSIIGATPKGGISPYSYIWSSNDTVSHLYNIPTGTYYVTVIDANNHTVSDSVSVTAFTDSIYSLIPGFSHSINSINGSLTITDTSHADCNVTSYLYGFYPLGDTSSLTNPVFDYDTAGVYTVCQTIIMNCTDGQIYMRGTCEDITLPAKVSTKLSTGSCNITLTTLGQILSSDIVSGATNYKYRVTKTGYSSIYVRGSSSNLFSIGWINSIEYAQTYNVEVAAYVNGFWSDYGPVCTVTTPANVPLTKLSSQYCNYTLTSLSQIISCNAVLNASNYQYHVFNSSLGFDKYYNRGSGSNLFSLSWITGIQNGETYSVAVKAYGGFWGNFGDTCLLTTPSQLRIINDINQFGGEFKVNEIMLFPNPATSEITIQFISNESEKTHSFLKLYDIHGRIVFEELLLIENGINEKSVNLEFLNNGIYLLEINIDNERIQKKFVLNSEQ